MTAPVAGPFPTMSMSIRTVVGRASATEQQFLRAIAADLRVVGADAHCRRHGNQTIFEVNAPQGVQLVIGGGEIRKHLLRSEQPFIRTVEQAGVAMLFASGNDVTVGAIAPAIYVCRTGAEFALFRYCRLMQGIASGTRVGRRICALVVDEGQERPFIMGAIGLASSLYSLAAREQHLKWVTDRQKQLGLRCILDLSTCVAVPPYSFLLGGKLLAALAFSEGIVSEFRSKYGDPLLALITTCATGDHCPIFNRIMVCSGGLYRRVGDTSGYSTAWVGQAARSAARRLSGLTTQEAGTQNIMRVLRVAFRRCGVPPESLLRLGKPKGVYFGSASKDNIAALEEGRRPRVPSVVRADVTVRYWKDKLVPKRLNNTAIMGAFQSHVTDDVLLGAQL